MSAIDIHLCSDVVPCVLFDDAIKLVRKHEGKYRALLTIDSDSMHPLPDFIIEGWDGEHWTALFSVTLTKAEMKIALDACKRIKEDCQ